MVRDTELLPARASFGSLFVPTFFDLLMALGLWTSLPAPTPVYRRHELVN